MDNHANNHEYTGVSDLLAGASEHVLSLGERACVEFLKDLARGRDVKATCDDFKRIPSATYQSLVAAMSSSVQRGRA